MKWEMVKLEEICDINMGKTPSRNNPEYWNGNIPWISISDLKGDYYISSTKEGITDLGVKESGIKPVEPNTLLYSFKLSIGKVAITSKKMYTNEAIVALPIKNTNEVLLSYLYWAIQMVDLSGIGDKAVKGITLNKEKLKSLQIPLPPLVTQKRIAAILDAADALRRKDQALLQKYNELAQAIFVDMFGDPVKNEKGWEKILFGDLYETRLGKMLDIKKQIGIQKYKYIGNSNLQWFRFNLGNLSEMEFDEKERDIFKLKKGDILICEGGEVGRAAIWNEESSEVFFQKAVHRARAKNKNIVQEYTVRLLWFFARNGGFKDFVSTSTISHLTGEKLKMIPIPVPPYDLQLFFLEKIEALNFANDNVKKLAMTSQTLFQSLLQKAFNAELVP